MQPAQLTFALEPRRTARLLTGAVTLLVAASLAGQLAKLLFGVDFLLGFIPLTYVDREANLPSWYSSFILLLAAAILWSIGSEARREGEPGALRWTGLALVFFLLSVDETAGVHELASGLTGRAVGGAGVLFYAWVLPGGLFALAVAAVYFRFLLALPGRTRAWVIAAAGCYLAGALGLEMATGWYVSTFDTKRSLAYVGLTHAEELLEMVGVVALVYALLDYKAARDGARLSAPAPGAAARAPR